MRNFLIGLIFVSAVICIAGLAFFGFQLGWFDADFGSFNIDFVYTSKEADPRDILVYAGEETITQGDYDIYYKEIQAVSKAYGTLAEDMSFDETMRTSFKKSSSMPNRNQILQRLIFRMVFRQEAQKLGIMPSEQELLKYYEQADATQANSGKGSRELTKVIKEEVCNQMGITMQKYKETVERGVLKEQCILQALVENHYGVSLKSVNDEMINAYYEQVMIAADVLIVGVDGETVRWQDS